MAFITHAQLYELGAIACKVEEICGEDGALVHCACLDDDDFAPHHPLCARDTVSPVLELLSLVPDYQPEMVTEILQEARDIIAETHRKLAENDAAASKAVRELGDYLARVEPTE